MIVRNEIERLSELGRMPNEDDNIPEAVIEEYSELLDISEPINYEEAKIIIHANQ